MLLRVTMSYSSSASRGSGETKGRSGQCQWLSWFNLPRFVELLLLQASTFPFFPTEVLYYLQNKTCPSPQLNWSMLINEQLGWAFFYGQCAGENRKEESKGWNGNGSTGSTHDLAFFDILTAIHWDWSPGSVELFILILWQYHLKVPNYAKQWNGGIGILGILKSLRKQRHDQSRPSSGITTKPRQLTLAEAFRGADFLRTMVTELSESSSDGFVASTCDFFFQVYQWNPFWLFLWRINILPGFFCINILCYTQKSWLRLKARKLSSCPEGLSGHTASEFQPW